MSSELELESLSELYFRPFMYLCKLINQNYFPLAIVIPSPAIGTNGFRGYTIRRANEDPPYYPDSSEVSRLFDIDVNNGGAAPTYLPHKNIAFIDASPTTSNTLNLFDIEHDEDSSYVEEEIMVSVLYPDDLGIVIGGDTVLRYQGIEGHSTVPDFLPLLYLKKEGPDRRVELFIMVLQTSSSKFFEFELTEVGVNYSNFGASVQVRPTTLANNPIVRSLALDFTHIPISVNNLNIELELIIPGSVGTSKGVVRVDDADPKPLKDLN